VPILKGDIMTIKSVREINFFQTLRDRELSISFYNTRLNNTNEQIGCFIHYLIKVIQEEIKKDQISQLANMEKECVASLVNKVELETLNKDKILNLTFLETIHLHNILDYFENNYDIFKAHVKKAEISHELADFIDMPATFYNTISNMKNEIELKLGEMVTYSYKFKHK
jgi:hypothetical protein